jgi:dipeptidyl aminopeptidase/acylaminoacyl peptidase
LLLTAAGAAILGLAVYAAISAYVYVQYDARFATVQAKCPPSEGFQDVQEPTSFRAWATVGGVRREIDTKPYQMPAPLDVTFPARNEPGVTVAAWWEPGPALDAPTVIVVHGANGCRRNSGNLLVAGMLHRHGIGVLLIDMRNHGDSTITDGKYAAGNDEHRDVLGAFDWLRAQGVPARRIGLFGFSGGAIASMVAIGEEPAVAAIWADSSITDAAEAIRDGLRDAGLPTVFDGGAVAAARLLTGDDLLARTPLAATAKLAGRPIALTQGKEDASLNPAYLETLAAAVRAAGGSPTVWQVPGAGHTEAHFLHPAEYERRLAEFFLPALGR